jgi:hypothetical protein
MAEINESNEITDYGRGDPERVISIYREVTAWPVALEPGIAQF